MGRIGDNSTDAFAGPLNNMFNFTANGGATKALILDPAAGTVVSSGPSATPTTAVASPKNLNTTQKQIALDGTSSTSANSKPLIYSWAVTSGTPSAVILGGNTATPTVQFSSGQGNYSFTLTVTDSAGATSTDTATVLYFGR